jgi:hypothetical protein
MACHFCHACGHTTCHHSFSTYTDSIYYLKVCTLLRHHSLVDVTTPWITSFASPYFWEYSFSITPHHHSPWSGANQIKISILYCLDWFILPHTYCGNTFCLPSSWQNHTFCLPTYYIIVLLNYLIFTKSYFAKFTFWLPHSWRFLFTHLWCHVYFFDRLNCLFSSPLEGKIKSNNYIFFLVLTIQSCRATFWLIVACGGAGSGAPWQPWDVGGHHCQWVHGLLVFTYIHRVSCVCHPKNLVNLESRFLLT